jgi:hypothetical protein
MKILFAALTASFVVLAPLASHATPRESGPANPQQHVSTPHVYWEGKDIGTDPDRNVRFELERDAAHYGVHR